MQTCQGVKLVIDHENLDCKDSIKYLGVVIHKNLTWNEHIESLIAKVNRRIGFLNRIKHLLPLDAGVALYNALIRPFFDFAVTIWGDRDNITLMHDLQILQNTSKAAKVILDLPYYASSTDALKTLGRPTLLQERLAGAGPENSEREGRVFHPTPPPHPLNENFTKNYFSLAIVAY